MIIWFTGLSGSGKTTLGNNLAAVLRRQNLSVECLDGDVVRRNLWPELGYGKDARNENVKRIGSLAKLLERHNVIVLVMVISPYRDARLAIRNSVLEFIEVFVNAPLSICAVRDPKGLYRKARLHEISGFTGIDDPYECPSDPEIECHTDIESLDESLRKILVYLSERSVIPYNPAWNGVINGHSEGI